MALETAPHVLTIHHLLVKVKNLERSKDIYVNILGLTPRPDAKPLPDGGSLYRLNKASA